MTGSSPSTSYVTRLAAGAALGGFLFGFDTSTMNAALNGIRATLDLGGGALGIVAAISLIGCAIGAWFAGPLSSDVGRTRVMSIAGGAIAAGSMGAALSGIVVLIVLSRLATGLGIGAASAVVPAYIAEIAPPRIRGRLGSLWQFALIVGQLLGLLADYGLTRWAGSEASPLPWGGAAWRWMFGLVAAIAAAYVLLARALPASPPDLVRHRRMNEAETLLARIIGAPAAAKEVQAIERMQAEKEAGRLGDLRGHRLGLRPIVWTGILLAAFQQLVGINVVKTYSNTLWTRIGFSIHASFTFSIVTVLISLIATVLAIALVDRVGRRALLITGAAVMTLGLGTLGAAFSTATGGGGDINLGPTASVTALVAMNVFAIAFGASWGPVTWVMLSELYDSDLRTPAVAVGTATNWVTNWAVTATFPLLAGVGLGFAYFVYTAFAGLALLFALKKLPETKGRTLS
jgi:SP family sugar:H+ symporter-like MFS transporter